MNKYWERCPSFQGGFSVVEILVVLLIAAILGTLAYPAYTTTIIKTRRAEGRSALMQLLQQQERYYSQHGTYLAFSSSSIAAEEKNFKWYSGDDPEKSAYEIKAIEECEDSEEADLRNCIMLVAMPGTAKVNTSFTDHECGNLMIDSRGRKTVSTKEARCWR